jgi:Uma2 family endonuclease
MLRPRGNRELMSASPAKRRPPRYDPTVYPSEDHMGEGSLQRFISELFRVLLERWLGERGKTSFVGSNQFIYWRQFDPSRKLAPDVFVLPGVRPGIKIDSWKTWETGIVPSFALEVVSQDYMKDYRDAPEPYAELGVQELVIFDPEHTLAPDERLRWQVYRRLAKRGFVRVVVSNADRVRSRVLGCWIRAVGDDLDSLRLRIAAGAEGETLLPTADEVADAQNAAREAARLALESERAARESERAARERVEAEVVRLRAENERLRSRRRSR